MYTCGTVFEIPKKEKEIEELERKSAAPDFWNDNERAQVLMRDLAVRREWVTAWQEVDRKREDAAVMLDLAEEARDESVFQEAEKELDDFEKAAAALEFRNMLSGEHDHNNAILTLHPGAGGTESQDWTQMLYRMYLRWIERSGFKYEVIDLQAGEEAGLKDATIEVTGPYAYGYLKAEAGVHRLVRISPFDANKRRHTSFASVFVLPVVENNVDIKIEEKDLRVDTYRASGAGGQHVNKTESAVRITHIPTGIVSESQDGRSQIKNREIALQRLYVKIADVQREQYESEQAAKRKSLVGSGDRSGKIRTYNFPQNRVTDHRLEGENKNFNLQVVMEGGLGPIIEALQVAENAGKMKEGAMG